MRLVNADALLGELDKYNDLSAKYKDDYLYGLQQRLETCIELVEDAPTVDAVEVVRCKDCRFSDWYTTVNGKRYCYCMEHGSSGHEEMDFCSYGERDSDT